MNAQWTIGIIGGSGLLAIWLVGSLREKLALGRLVIVDRFIDRTVRRPPSLFGTGMVAHVSMAKRVCPRLSAFAAAAVSAAGRSVAERKTHLVTEGPQFSTRAASLPYRQWGADLEGRRAGSAVQRRAPMVINSRVGSIGAKVTFWRTARCRWTSAATGIEDRYWPIVSISPRAAVRTVFASSCASSVSRSCGASSADRRRAARLASESDRAGIVRRRRIWTALSSAMDAQTPRTAGVYRRDRHSHQADTPAWPGAQGTAVQDEGAVRPLGHLDIHRRAAP